jgi:dTDP-4-dehydrorhamnose reductase
LKVLVTGSGGMLARDLIPILKKRHEVIAPPEKDLDITERENVFSILGRLRPDLVVNCAAYTQVDKAEEEREKAFLVNGIGVQNLALACNEQRIPLCHISTDYVFNGERDRPYTPFDNTDPINAYGASKLAGERFIQWIMNAFYIIRTSWLYGKGGNNFVSTIMRIAGERPEIRVVHDQRGAPTSTVTLSRAVLALIETGAYGIYHVTDKTEEGLSWYEFAGEIVRLSGLSASIIPITTREFPRPAMRPRYSVLDASIFSLVTGDPLPEWRNALKDFLSPFEPRR